ncbi:MAG: nucleoside deaminase, partial [Bacteroidota bacterium]
YMNEALKQAKIAFDLGEIPVGAVVVCDNKIIARAHNEVERLNDVTAHAEILAITAAENHLGSKYLTQCKLYVTLEPCVMCAGATAWAQLEGIIYGASDAKRGFSRVQEQITHPKTAIKSGVKAEECGALVTSFFSKLRGEQS